MVPLNTSIFYTILFYEEMRICGNWFFFNIKTNLVSEITNAYDVINHKSLTLSRAKICSSSPERFKGYQSLIYLKSASEYTIHTVDILNDTQM